MNCHVKWFVFTFELANAKNQICKPCVVHLQNCMLGVDQHQLWIGSQDSVIYIINTHSMSCNKQLTEHRSEVTDFALEEKDHRFT